MTFGSDDFYQKIKCGMASGGNESFYSEVLSVIERDVFPRIQRQVYYPDCDDVLQQVLIAVWVSLARFVMTSEKLTVAQRNSWLLRIVDNKIADYYRNRYAQKEDISAEEALYNITELNDPYVRLEADEDLRKHQDFFDNTIHYICSMNIVPEKIIAFFYSKFIFFLESGGTLKGSAKYAYEKINGKTFSEVWHDFQQDMELALGRRLPIDVLVPLQEKMDELDRYTVISIEVNAISDSTNYIVKRLRKGKESEAVHEVK